MAVGSVKWAKTRHVSQYIRVPQYLPQLNGQCQRSGVELGVIRINDLGVGRVGVASFVTLLQRAHAL